MVPGATLKVNPMVVGAVWKQCGSFALAERAKQTWYVSGTRGQSLLNSAANLGLIPVELGVRMLSHWAGWGSNSARAEDGLRTRRREAAEEPKGWGFDKRDGNFQGHSLKFQGSAKSGQDWGYWWADRGWKQDRVTQLGMCTRFHHAGCVERANWSLGLNSNFAYCPVNQWIMLKSLQVSQDSWCRMSQRGGQKSVHLNALSRVVDRTIIPW